MKRIQVSSESLRRSIDRSTNLTRKVLISSCCILFLVLFSAPADGTGSPTDEVSNELELAREKVYPALVNIAVVGQSFEGGRSRKFPAAGSGVIVTPEGHVLTNYHVAGETTRITCRLVDGRKFEGAVIVHDPLTDLSVLRLELPPGERVQHAELGDSDSLQVGDQVLAMGNPQTLSSSMTLGIVSHPRRVFTSFTGAEIEERDLGSGQMTGLLTRWIQHDALILGGNSGGPLVDLAGNVVGINELGGNGVGFAIPSNLAQDVLEQALEHGEVRRGWFGLSVLPVDKLGLNEGALVSWVVEEGPADRAGLQPGDRILSVEGNSVAVRAFEEVPVFYERLSRHLEGESVEVTFDRDGRQEKTTVVVDRLGDSLDDQTEIREWGITVRGITRQMALARRYSTTDGVLITGLRPGRPADAATPPLARGDVILEFDGVPIVDRRTFVSAWREHGDDGAVLRIRRGNQDLVTVLEPAPSRENSYRATELPKAWIGVETQVIFPAIAKALGHEGTRGFRVTRVLPQTMAASAGIQVGDIITAIDGRPLKAYRSQDQSRWKRAIESLTIGEEASLTVHRPEGELEVPVTLEATPQGPSRAKKGENDFFEFEFRAITAQDRHKKRWNADVTGALVTGVTAGGWASLSGLAVMDRIISVDDTAISGIASLQESLAAIEEQKPERVRFFVERGYRTTYIFIEPDWELSH